MPFIQSSFFSSLDKEMNALIEDKQKIGQKRDFKCFFILNFLFKFILEKIKFSSFFFSFNELLTFIFALNLTIKRDFSFLLYISISRHNKVFDF